MGYIPRTCPACGANLDPGEICDCKKYYTVIEVASRWSVSSDLVYDLLRRRELVGMKVGSAWRISAAMLREYEDRQTAKRPQRIKNRKPVLKL